MPLLDNIAQSRTTSNQQPVGFALPDWQPRPSPEAIVLSGRTCRLEPLCPEQHADALCQALLSTEASAVWTYLPHGPFTEASDLRQHLERISSQSDPLQFAVIEQSTNQALGTLALMRIDPTNGVAEIGFVTFSPALQRTTMATEAHFLLLQYLFDTLGFRRCEWKCDHLNAPSKQAALRLGFQFEGLFRQAVVYKQRNRDTAWFSIIDAEWSFLRHALTQWLSSDNFTPDGKQKRTLADIRQHAFPLNR